MKYSFHQKAVEEFEQAIDYYEGCSRGLGEQFAKEVYLTIQRILDFPKAWQILHKDIRRCLTNRFPFGVIYYQKDNQIIILAIMHLKRKPNYWKDRK